MPIVAAIDRSERADPVVRQAGDLGRAFDEPIHAVHVLTRDEFVSLERTSVTQDREAISMDRIRDFAEEVAAERLEATGVVGESVGLVGDPAEEIVEYAEEVDADYIVVAGRKRSAVGKALFGSVSQSILIESDHPVVSLRDVTAED